MTLVNDAEKRARSVLAAGSGIGHDACRETAYKLARDVVALVEAYLRDAKTWGGAMQERDDARAALKRLASDENFTAPDPDGALAYGFSQELRARREFAKAALDG